MGTPNDSADDPGAICSIEVVLDAGAIAAWQRQVLQAVEHVPGVRLGSVRHVAAVRGARGRLWRLLGNIEARLLGRWQPATAPARDGSGGAVAPEGPSELLLWLAAGPPGEGEACPVLWLAHGPGLTMLEPALRAAVASSAPGLRTVVMLRERPGEPPVEVARLVSGVRPFSITLTRDEVLWRSAEALETLVRDVGADGTVAIATGRPLPETRLEPVPSASRFLATASVRWLRVLAVRVMFRRPWEVVVRQRRDPWSPRGWTPGTGGIAWKSGHFYADPVLFECAGRHHLFCEDVGPGDPRGAISHVELGLPHATPEVVLERQHHLSYPQVFEVDGDIYMIPETMSARCVELYRATDFPRGWELEAVLLEGVDALDATVVLHDGRWWMFVAMMRGGGTHQVLELYWAVDLRGPWKPHARNPISSDVRAARPGGPIIRCGDRLIRPAQDNSRRYGGAVSLREIDTLGPGDYAEHEVARLDPDEVGWGRAVHTYTRDSAYEAIDVRRRILRVGNPLRRR